MQLERVDRNVWPHPVGNTLVQDGVDWALQIDDVWDAHLSNGTSLVGDYPAMRVAEQDFLIDNGDGVEWAQPFNESSYVIEREICTAYADTVE